jgi:hypothetical protein
MRIQILLLIKVMGICDHWNMDPPRLHFGLQASIVSLKNLWILTIMRIWIRIQLFTLLRIQIRIQLPKIMRIHANPDLQP